MAFGMKLTDVRKMVEIVGLAEYIWGNTALSMRWTDGLLGWHAALCLVDQLPIKYRRGQAVDSLPCDESSHAQACQYLRTCSTTPRARLQLLFVETCNREVTPRITQELVGRTMVGYSEGCISVM